MRKHDYQLLKSFVDDYEVFPLPRELPQQYLEHCAVVADRYEILSRLPKGGVVAEIGTAAGHFAKRILEITAPKTFHIFDLTFREFDRPFFQAAIDAGRVVLHEGDSPTELAKLQSQTFDWIYIDGDHFFEGVSRDIDQAIRLIKPEGIIVFNDYTIYSPFERVQYGVMRAVHDLCLDEDFEFIMLSLSTIGYPDVAVRRRLPQTA